MRKGDHGNGIREFVNHPGFIGCSESDCDRKEADGDLLDQDWCCAGGENRQACPGGIDHEEAGTVRRDFQWMGFTGEEKLLFGGGDDLKDKKKVENDNPYHGKSGVQELRVSSAS
ncbi:hypothetical protein N9245_01645 [bacterium]|nr:hypothetical protein [bacterium]